MERPAGDPDPSDYPLASFRAEARAWLVANAGPYRADGGSPSLVFADVADPGHVVRGRAWQRRLYDAGWAGLGWPVEYGGRGLSVAERVVWAQEVAAAGVAPGINLLGEAVVGPTLLVHGTEEQKGRYLAPMLRGDDVWCQLFSEPDAGTDLAAVATAAVRDGDGWLVTGHKAWTSAAHYADRGLLLARTDPDVPGHEGCTCFALDVRAPGVTVRPVRQMTGGSAFADVVLDRVRVADADRVGPVGGGWSVAMTALQWERLNLGLGAARVAGEVTRILAELRPRGVADDPAVRQRAAQVWIEAKVLDVLGERMTATGPGSSAGAVARLAATRLARRRDELLDAVRGAGAMLVDDWTLFQLWVPATRIGGGTEEALRTVVAERVLGLPKPPPTAPGGVG